MTALADPALWSDLFHLDGHLPRGIALAPREVTAAIRNTADRLSRNRPALLAVLLAPGLLPERIAALLDEPSASSAQTWMWTCWIGEATWLAIADTTPEDAELLRPVASRLRFLALSEAFRGGPGDSRSLWRDGSGDPALDLGMVFGIDAANLLELRCRQARWEWHRCLDAYQSHPLLAAASPAEIESEIDALAFRYLDRGRPTARRRRTVPGPPLVTDWGVINDASRPLSADDRALLDDVLDRHLLPRMRLGRVVRAAAYPAGGTALRWPAVATAARWSRRWAGVLPLLGAAGALALAGCGQFHAAAITAAGSYMLLGVLVVVFGRIWATAWLLRLPAAGTVGLFALLTLHFDWWQNPAGTWWAPAALTGASIGYLVVEARNHGVAAVTSIGRALTIATVGAAHAFLVAVIGLVAVAPALVENGRDLRASWHTWPTSIGLATLGLGTAWCLAVGVFAQILWDDRPITAPLAHLRWRR
ncbi:hypothetical protein GCM10011608_60000 [Micromonospora sonchi]|uniref:Uncharacterized protein n=1 Tax=Micromonospora sonchi TaxID=1763543 RepID=A0A917U999_9ACTN|nr:hypothetical protein [Micromonospora sonchi]GGM66679.1 hypothetical protein GCM10011608_60000 [Micromonospora sonchi]